MKYILGLISVIILVFLVFGAKEVGAQPGIAISPGIIKTQEPLRPGTYYNLPSMQVINNGKDGSEYKIELAKVAGLKELSPPAEYIDFNPKSFHLEPGASQIVKLGLSLPVKAKPGDYLAYIEAHPVVSPEKGGVSIGIAAATKLYFTVKPANTWVAIWTAITSFMATRAPASYIILGIVLGLIVVGIGVLLFRKYVKLEVKIGRK